MCDHGNQDPSPEPRRARPVGGTEFSWCKAVPTGTGITVLALLLSKHPDIQLLTDALHKLQNGHPILRSKLRLDKTSNTFSYITPPSPHIQIHTLDLPFSSNAVPNSSVSPFHLVLEHELNKNSWSSSHAAVHSPVPDGTETAETETQTETDVLFASLYTLGDRRWAFALRLHTSACDRAAAAALLRGLLEVVAGGGGIEKVYENEAEVSLGIESMIPDGKANKPFWARGVDMLGYSLNSFRLSNLKFVDAASPRASQVVRLQMNPHDTHKLVSVCKSREIKLCGALAAAALIVARSTKDLPHRRREKYAVVTLIDCRSILDPVLSSHHIGFYHSAILNTHDVSGDENLWELAKRCYTSFANAKSNNKHFTDMNDVNFLMCKAIENPGLTPSSSCRTAFLSVFEDPVFDDSNAMHGKVGLEDYVGCSSVHGVGPTIAIFDTIRDGGLDCACVYPSPLHSREQMQKCIDDMKRILVEGCANLDVE